MGDLFVDDRIFDSLEMLNPQMMHPLKIYNTCDYESDK